MSMDALVFLSFPLINIFAAMFCSHGGNDSSKIQGQIFE